MKMTNKELKELSTKMFNYRVEHNLSAKKFAELCKLTMPTVYNIENRKQSPSKMTVRKILNVIEVKEKDDEAN
jgi:transcriptional regulator with XRE-family HTH domain